MSKYLVHFRRNSLTTVTPEVLKHEQQRMSELIHEKILIDVKMSKNMDNLWLNFDIGNREEVTEIIKTLPMCKSLFFDIYEIM